MQTYIVSTFLDPLKSMKKIPPTQNQPRISETDGKPLSILHRRQRTPRKKLRTKIKGRANTADRHAFYTSPWPTPHEVKKYVFSLTEENKNKVSSEM
jgi:hypothetical protein